MIIRKAQPADIPVIHNLAEQIWRPTYRDLMSAEQLDFMLEDMYSELALAAQFDSLDFFVAERAGEPVAFAAISATDDAVHKLHKIYILPSEQGKGTGKALIAFIEDQARDAGSRVLELNVKRDNPALGFYLKQGFVIYKEVDIPYYRFVLTDYVMRKEI